jgi:hypothetical protein
MVEEWVVRPPVGAGDEAVPDRGRNLGSSRGDRRGELGAHESLVGLKPVRIKTLEDDLVGPTCESLSRRLWRADRQQVTGASALKKRAAGRSGAPREGT